MKFIYLIFLCMLSALLFGIKELCTGILIYVSVKKTIIVFKASLKR
jgi:hypothetical protein